MWANVILFLRDEKGFECGTRALPSVLGTQRQTLIFVHLKKGHGENGLGPHDRGARLGSLRTPKQCSVLSWKNPSVPTMINTSALQKVSSVRLIEHLWVSTGGADASIKCMTLAPHYYSGLNVFFCGSGSISHHLQDEALPRSGSGDILLGNILISLVVFIIMFKTTVFP